MNRCSTNPSSQSDNRGSTALQTHIVPRPSRALYSTHTFHLYLSACYQALSPAGWASQELVALALGGEEELGPDTGEKDQWMGLTVNTTGTFFGGRGFVGGGFLGAMRREESSSGVALRRSLIEPVEAERPRFT